MAVFVPPRISGAAIKGTKCSKGGYGAPGSGLHEGHNCRAHQQGQPESGVSRRWPIVALG